MSRTARRSIALLAASLGLVGCGAVPAAPPKPAGAVDYAALHDRPMRLPTISPNAGCPVSPQVRVPPGPPGVKSAVPAYAFGSGPAYLSGQIGWYAGPPGQIGTVLIDGTYTGPLLIRVRRLDGLTKVTLVAETLPVDEPPLAGTLPAGTTSGDGVEAAVPAGTSGWSSWFGRLTADTPGCYGIQVDGASFTSVIVFTVRPGPIPPG